MSLSRYLVRVHCCNSWWLIEVPAVGRWTPVDDKRAIADTARAMIAAVTEASADAFGIDLVEDRVVSGIEEFAGATDLKRWRMAMPTGTVCE
ncbi:hypothetical protein [Nocardia mexicana]|uniref:Uncharacterized protein n=1 Tax=Nocardia mexicana TaxID=279262 RepID=A0A370H9K5_9NOCA|nr:hypothetical protein [Nocardia mexicana]RDI53331.1 hypothetical protein DFR68_103720 [Nocardia mexicana]